ncbi:MAG: ATP-binding protein [Lachnospiraceae bacterium]|nr:ATP-binding protein [Lachnospiraceae bacterium]
MIRRLIRQMLFAQIFSALTVSVCLLIDSVIIGRYLGVEALSAYQLASPVLLVLAAFGSMLAAGIQVACSKSLGKGSQEETNRGYSSAIVLGFGVAFSLMLFVFLFRSFIARASGAGSEGTLFTDTRDYMTAFVIGAPATMGALILVPFLQIAGQSGILVAAVLAMTVTDIALDLVNVFVVHGGMFGMGLASAISYYCALIVGGWYFFTKKCVFKFSLKQVSFAKMREMLAGGLPSLINMAAGVVLVVVLNQILLGTGGALAVAAFSVISTIGNSANCVSTGINGVTLTLSGILYQEEDRTGLKVLIQTMARSSVFLGIVVGAVLILCAPLFARFFITEDSPARDMAVTGIRLYSAGMIPICLTAALKSSYQGMEKTRLTELISVMEQLVFPAVGALILSRFLGTFGVWFYFVSGELLTLLMIAVLIRQRTKSAPWRDGAYLLLNDSFGVPADQLMETDIATLEDAVRVSQEAEQFCLERGQSSRLSKRIALCIEEMAANVIDHGFKKDDKPHRLSVRLLHKEDSWVIRFRDDCRAFDPVHYIPAEGKDALGIRLTLAMADEAQYTYSLSLNNLALRLPGEREEAS